MTAAQPLSVETVTLLDGTDVRIRAMEPDDADRLLRFHATLSANTTHLRYFSVHPRLTDAEVERFTHVDHLRREALVAQVDDEIIAVGRFDRLGAEPDAEVAFVVSDVWQGHGLGTILLARLARRARAVGIHRLVADTLPHNRSMLDVFRHAGLPMRSSFDADGGVIHVVLDLEGAPAPA